MILACMVLVIQTNINVLIIFRVVKGIPVGFFSSVGPIYMGEMSSPKRRGLVVAVYQTSIITGMMIDYIINFAFHRVYYGWKFISFLFLVYFYYFRRYEFGLVALPPLLLLIFSIFIPELYSWKVSHSQDTAAHPQEKERAGSSRNPSSVSNMPSSSTEADSPPQNTQNSGLTGFIRDLCSAPRALILGISLAVGQQWSGINAVLNFSPSILEDLGLDTTDEKLIGTIFVGLWNVLATLIPIAFV